MHKESSSSTFSSDLGGRVILDQTEKSRGIWIRAHPGSSSLYFHWRASHIEGRAEGAPSNYGGVVSQRDFLMSKWDKIALEHIWQ